MPTNVDADTSTQDLVEQVRAVAFATRTLADSPGDIPSVLAGLAQANRRLMQVYSQVANAQHAVSGTTPFIGGVNHAQDSAAALRRAVRLVERLDGELDVAYRASARIERLNPVVDETAIDFESGAALDPEAQGIGV